jgi:hypothetical protein
MSTLIAFCVYNYGTVCVVPYPFTIHCALSTVQLKSWLHPTLSVFVNYCFWPTSTSKLRSIVTSQHWYELFLPQQLLHLSEYRTYLNFSFFKYICFRFMAVKRLNKSNIAESLKPFPKSFSSLLYWNWYLRGSSVEIYGAEPSTDIKLLLTWTKTWKFFLCMPARSDSYNPSYMLNIWRVTAPETECIANYICIHVDFDYVDVQFLVAYSTRQFV